MNAQELKQSNFYTTPASIAAVIDSHTKLLRKRAISSYFES